MSLRSSLALLRIPLFAPTVLGLLLAILAEAVAGSYQALLAVERIHMTPLELGIFLTLASLSGIVVTTFFGHLHDKRPRLWPLLLSLSAKILAFALAALVTQPWMLIAIGVLLTGFSSASFSLFFAIAKGHLDRAGGDAVPRGMAMLRMTNSLAWAIGPALAAGLVSLWSFEGAFFGGSALAVLSLVTVLVTRLKVVPALAEERGKVTFAVVRATAPAVLGLTAYYTALFMGGTAMIIIVGGTLGNDTDVGLLFSLCAGIEVVIMALFVIRPMTRVNHGLLIGGFLIFAAYFLILLVWPTLLSFYAAQALRAAAIAIISILGMAYIQELLPGRTGTASALFGNTFSAGALLSGLGTGLWAQSFGYGTIFFVSLGLSLFGAAAIALGRRLTRPALSVSEA